MPIQMFPFSFSAGIEFLWGAAQVWLSLCVILAILKMLFKTGKNKKDYQRDEADSLSTYKELAYTLKEENEHISMIDIARLEELLENHSSKMHKAIFGEWKAQMNEKKIKENSHSFESSVSTKDKESAINLLVESISRQEIATDKFPQLMKEINGATSASDIAKILRRENLV